MNAERLLTHYEKISDASDAIPRLRQFILELAVRGKLVEQDSKDRPAVTFDGAICAKVIPPFDVPNNWNWTRLCALGRVVGGRTPSMARDDYWDGEIPWVSPKDMKIDYVSEAQMSITEAAIAGSAANIVPARSVLFVVRGMILAHSFPIAVTRVPVAINQDMKALVLQNTDMADYVLWMLKGMKSEMLRRVRRSSHGTCRIERSDYKDFLVPVPPFAEQYRIVTKVNELMTLCGQLQSERTEREVARDRMTASIISRLNTPDPDLATFQNHAAFALENLTLLTARPDQIKHLRQTIFNLAIRGKLVPQNPIDEPASALLERIALEKARLAKTGEIKKDKRHQPTVEDQGKFQIPPSWCWCRLGSLSKVVTSGSRDWAKYYSNEGAVFVRMGNLSKDNYQLRLDNIQRVKAPSVGEGTRTRLEAGDLLISITGDVGMLGLIPENFGEAYINQHTAMVRPMDEMKGRYLPELFRSPFAQEQFNAPQRGIKNSFRLTDITEFLVPLPPLAEQHRIVAKADELMGLCDQLEQRLTTGTDARQRLLDAVLHDALESQVRTLEPDADSKVRRPPDPSLHR